MYGDIYSVFKDSYHTVHVVYGVQMYSSPDQWWKSPSMAYWSYDARCALAAASTIQP